MEETELPVGPLVLLAAERVFGAAQRAQRGPGAVSRLLRAPMELLRGRKRPKVADCGTSFHSESG